MACRKEVRALKVAVHDVLSVHAVKCACRSKHNKFYVFERKLDNLIITDKTVDPFGRLDIADVIDKPLNGKDDVSAGAGKVLKCEVNLYTAIHVLVELVGQSFHTLCTDRTVISRELELTVLFQKIFFSTTGRNSRVSLIGGCPFLKFKSMNIHLCIPLFERRIKASTVCIFYYIPCCIRRKPSYGLKAPR